MIDGLNGRQTKIISKMRSKLASIAETRNRLTDKENKKKNIERQISALHSSIQKKQEKIGSLESKLQGRVLNFQADEHD